MKKDQTNTTLIILCFIVIIFMIGNPNNHSKLNKDEQQNCSILAKTYFDKNWNTPDCDIPNYTYKSNFNSKLNKCFIAVSGIGGDISNYQLRDVNSNTYTAICGSYTKTPELNSCFLGDKKKQEFDLEKYNNFISFYMNN